VTETENDIRGQTEGLPQCFHLYASLDVYIDIYIYIQFILLRIRTVYFASLPFHFMFVCIFEIRIRITLEYCVKCMAYYYYYYYYFYVVLCSVTLVIYNIYTEFAFIV